MCKIVQLKEVFGWVQLSSLILDLLISFSNINNLCLSSQGFHIIL